MYDNECGLCYRITRFFKLFDFFDKIQWVSKDWKGDFPLEGREKVSKSVVVYNPSTKNIYIKSHAVAKIINCVPFGFLISWILRLPVLSYCFDKLYDIIAKNRNQIFKRID